MFIICFALPQCLLCLLALSDVTGDAEYGLYVPPLDPALMHLSRDRSACCRYIGSLENVRLPRDGDSRIITYVRGVVRRDEFSDAVSGKLLSGNFQSLGHCLIGIEDTAFSIVDDDAVRCPGIHAAIPLLALPQFAGAQFEKILHTQERTLAVGIGTKLN